ncbi:MAG: filamentous hemagglutinin N-terminal domain-containing protein, partial [Pseudomonas sp.]
MTVGGSATINRAGTTTTINQTSNRAIIDWRSFDVKGNESVNFIQPSRGSIAVNRIHDSKASQIDGSITANGNIMLLNQNGVLFGKSARVDVGGLVAGAGDLVNPNEFMAGAAARIDGAHSGAAVVNRGRITIAPGGLAG